MKLSENTLHTDSELIKKLKKDDLEAFNQIFYNYSSKLYHFAYSYLKSKEEAEELVQDVFYKIWEKRKDIKEEFQFRSYLFSIAFNQIKKSFRSKALLNKYLASGQPDDSNSGMVNQDVNYSSLKSLVEKLVDAMPEKRREVFRKSRFEGKNAKEISAEMNLSQSTVENHLLQALNFLRKHLNEENMAGLLFFWLFLK